MAHGPATTRPEPTVVAVIANYGPSGVAMTLATLAAVRRQSGSIRLAIVVVDDGSGPETVESLKASLPDGVALIARSENRGYAAACNEGIRRAGDQNATHVWLLNNDLDMPDSTLSSLADALVAHPKWAAVAPVTLSATPPHLVLGAGVRLWRTRARVRHMFEGLAQASLPTAPYEVDAIEGAAPLVSMAAIAGVGDLDEGYRMYWEDTDWSVRARAAGWSLGVEPAARVFHLVSQSTTSLERTEFMLTNRVRFADRNGRLVSRLLFRVYFVLGWLPLYALTRLVPRYGLRSAAGVSSRVLRQTMRRHSSGARPR